jgi:hypothetical protein
MDRKWEEKDPEKRRQRWNLLCVGVLDSRKGPKSRLE